MQKIKQGDLSPTTAPATAPRATKGSKQQLRDAAAGRVRSEAEKHKGTLATGLGSVSSAMRSSKTELNDNLGWLANGIDVVADRVDGLSDDLNSKSPDELASEVKAYAMANPVAFLMGCAAAGFALSRLLKAGAESEGVV